MEGIPQPTATQPEGTTTPAATNPPTQPAPAVPTPQPQVTPPATPPVPAPAPITMTSEQLKERLDRAKGSAQEELLKSLGFKSADEARTLIESIREKEKQAELERLSKLSETARLEEEKKKAQQERDQERAAREARERELEDLKRQSQVREMESKLSRDAMAAGVRGDEVEYALYAYQRELQSRSEDEVAQMPSPKVWFETELKKRRPHVFADYQPSQQQMATTGPPPAPANPGETQTQVVPEKKDATSMSPKEWAAYKARLGVG